MTISLDRFEPLTRTIQNAAGATGNGNNIELNSGYGTVALQMTGIFVGTVTFEISFDGTNFVGVLGTDTATGTTALTSTTPNAVLVNVKGAKLLRARISAWTSGPITVTAIAVPV